MSGPDWSLSPKIVLDGRAASRSFRFLSWRRWGVASESVEASMCALDVGVRRVVWRGTLFGAMFGVAMGASGCPQPAPPASGDLQVVTGGNIWLDQPVAQDPVVLNAAQLESAPSHAMGTETLKYQDGFSSAGSPTYIIVTARDPNEQEATLESIVGARAQGAFTAQSVAPTDLPSAYPGGVITLPNAYGIPYPVQFPDTPPQSSWPLANGDFTGTTGGTIGSYPPSSSPPSGLPTLFRSGTQGIYLQQLGVCAYDIDVKSVLVDQLTSSLPSLVSSGIAQGLYNNSNFPGSEINLTRVTTDALVTTFVNRRGVTSPYGGAVALISITGTYNIFDTGGIIPDTFNSLNYTFEFGLQDGLFSVAPSENGWYDSGGVADQSTSLRTGIEGTLPAMVSGTVREQSIAKQARPIPAGVLNKQPACKATGNLPSSCYVACRNLPSPLPAQPSATDPDDSSWYSTDYCSDAILVLQGGVQAGATDYGLSTGQGSLLANALTAQHGGLYNNIRCNFYPTYETDKTPVPVCEVVARAKRLTVLPDIAELVWSDGSSLQNVNADEYAQGTANPAFALYLLLLGGQQDTSLLCASQGQQQQMNGLFNVFPFQHPFPHGHGSNMTQGM